MSLEVNEGECVLKIKFIETTLPTSKHILAIIATNYVNTKEDFILLFTPGPTPVPELVRRNFDGKVSRVYNETYFKIMLNKEEK